MTLVTMVHLINKSFSYKHSLPCYGAISKSRIHMFYDYFQAQARECLLEKLQLQSKDNRTVDIYLDLAQEASQLSECYNTVNHLITSDLIHDYVPYSWTTLIQVKKEYYTGLAHYHAASGILHKNCSKLTNTTREALLNIHVGQGQSISLQTPEDRRLLGISLNNL